MRYSAGLLPYRTTGSAEIFLVHMAGPFWAHKDDGAWSVAKGEYDPTTEEPWQVACREFEEEVGVPAPAGEVLDVGEHRMPSGKRVRVFAVRTDADLRFVSSNMFTLEWPHGSGEYREFPETDGAAWFDLATAQRKIMTGQRGILAAFTALQG